MKTGRSRCDERRADAIDGASVVADVSNSPSFEDAAALEFFQTSTRNLLADPDSAPAFAAAHRSIETNTRSSTMFLETWEQRRADSHSDLDILAAALFAAGGFIAVLTVATAAVIVTGRMAAETRRVGTLKAVGVTPRLIVLMLLIEYLGIAVLATAIGLSVGRLLAPGLAGTSLTILGPPEPPLSWPRVGIVAAVAVAVVLLGTIRPAIRGIRHSTLRSLQSGARRPKRPARLARLAARVGLPVTGVLGMRSAWRRPGGLLTNAAGPRAGHRHDRRRARPHEEPGPPGRTARQARGRAERHGG
jgi:putative ABC transport system permease protein